MISPCPSPHSSTPSADHCPPPANTPCGCRYRAPYHWPSTLGFLTARCIPGIETCIDGTYRRTLAIAGHHAVLHATPLRNQLRVHLERRSLNCIAWPDRQTEALLRPRRQTLCGIAAELSRDPLMARLARERPGLRVP